MQKHSVEAIVRGLNENSVRYMIAGGLAVVAHGHLRFTADVDLVLDLDEGNARKALAALAALGYEPRAPVPIEAFADGQVRARWIREKGLTVFSLHSRQHPATEVDLFVESPLDFEQAYSSAAHLDVAPGVTATFLGYHELIELKRRAGRPQDVADIEQLEKNRQDRSE